MKQILVGVDFSKNSIHALEYAIQFANKVGADITLLWVNNTATSEYIFDETLIEIKKEKKSNLEKLIDQYQGQLAPGKMSYKLRKGKVHLEVASQAKQINADLIVAGTHGVSGFEEYWIGSNAYRIVTHAPCPVITIRFDFPFGKNAIRRILLPIDSSQETKQKLPVTLQIARSYKAEIHVLAMYSTSVKAIQRRVDNHANQVKEILDREGIPCVMAGVEADNLTNATLNYAQESKADLIAIMTEQENTTANIFLGPFAQQLINHSAIPILSLRSKELVT
jgi:nucleotide-binding universal stress UspA family protein